MAESQSNGAAEEACRTVKGMSRALRHSLEALHGISIGPAHPVLPWMVQHGAFLVSRGQLGSDGKTAFSGTWKSLAETTKILHDLQC